MRMHQTIDGTDRYIDVPDVASVIKVHEESGWVEAPEDEPAPAADSPDPVDEEAVLDELRAELASLGRPVAQRWREARLRREIEAARSDEPVDETEDE